MSSSKSIPIGLEQPICNGRYVLQKMVGHGGFGDVYSGVDTRTQRPVAIKVEKVAQRSWLYHEARIMKELNSGKVPGVPTLHYFSQEGDFRVLVMSLFSQSLEDLHERHNRFSLKTTVMLVIQMLSLLERFHGAGFIHRDLKPDNFLVDVATKQNVFMIDFGLSSRWHEKGVHKVETSGRTFIGTTRYASLATHKGITQSRRDDLEQLAYIAIYMYRGRLPWSGLNIVDRDKKEHTIGKMKADLPLATICNKCPGSFLAFLQYCRGIGFTDTPEYEAVRTLFHQTLEKDLITSFDSIYDWIEPPKPVVQSPLMTDSFSHSTVNGIGGSAILSSVNRDSPAMSPSTVLQNGASDNNEASKTPVNSHLPKLSPTTTSPGGQTFPTIKQHQYALTSNQRITATLPPLV